MSHEADIWAERGFVSATIVCVFRCLFLAFSVHANGKRIEFRRVRAESFELAFFSFISLLSGFIKRQKYALISLEFNCITIYVGQGYDCVSCGCQRPFSNFLIEIQAFPDVSKLHRSTEVGKIPT
jgi:hypothetical protein